MSAALVEDAWLQATCPDMGTDSGPWDSAICFYQRQPDSKMESTLRVIPGTIPLVLPRKAESLLD